MVFTEVSEQVVCVMMNGRRKMLSLWLQEGSAINLKPCLLGVVCIV